MTAAEWAELGKAMPGSVGIYRINRDVMETLYLSEDVPEILTMDKTEYHTLTKDDAMDVVCVPDRPAVLESVRKCVTERVPADIYYRAYHGKHGFNWVHAQGKI